jgi:hypothetical protein
MLRRLFGILLALVTALGLIGAAAEEGAFTFRINNNDTAIITGFEGEKAPQILKIPERVEGRTVIGIDGGAFARRGEIRQVELPASVSYIGEGAFADCCNLEKLVGPKMIAYSSIPAASRVTIPFTGEEDTVTAAENAFDNTLFRVNELKAAFEPQQQQKQVERAQLQRETASAKKGSNAAGIIIGILIVLAAAFVYFAVLPKSRKDEAKEPTEEEQEALSDSPDASEAAPDAQTAGEETETQPSTEADEKPEGHEQSAAKEETAQEDDPAESPED